MYYRCMRIYIYMYHYVVSKRDPEKRLRVSHSQTYVRTHTCIIYVFTYTYIYDYVVSKRDPEKRLQGGVCENIYLYICVLHIYIHVHICISMLCRKETQERVSYVCMFTCTNMYCTYIYKYMYLLVCHVEKRPRKESNGYFVSKRKP